jgi:hypothetical protein
MTPKILSNPKWKTKYNKLDDKQKEQYCWIEDYLIQYVCDDISLQTFILKVMKLNKKYEQRSI